MAKQKIPETVTKKFSKKLFKENQFVVIDWLGQTKYGYITKIKKSGAYYSYSVKTSDKTYPCGVQIGQHRTAAAGNIKYDDVTEFGPEIIESRYRLSTISRPTYIKPASTESETKDVGRSADATVNKDAPKPRRTNNRRKNDIQSSSSRNDGSNRKNTKRNSKPSYSKLDEAIQKQRDFLRKFT